MWIFSKPRRPRRGRNLCSLAKWMKPVGRILGWEARQCTRIWCQSIWPNRPSCLLYTSHKRVYSFMLKTETQRWSIVSDSKHPYLKLDKEDPQYFPLYNWRREISKLLDWRAPTFRCNQTDTRVHNPREAESIGRNCEDSSKAIKDIMFSSSKMCINFHAIFKEFIYSVRLNTLIWLDLLLMNFEYATASGSEKALDPLNVSEQGLLLDPGPPH